MRHGPATAQIRGVYNSIKETWGHLIGRPESSFSC